VPLPPRPPRSYRRESHARRWLAAIGLVAIAAVAILSLGGSHFGDGDDAAKAGPARVVGDPAPAAKVPAGETPDAPALSRADDAGEAGRTQPAAAASTPEAAGTRYAVHVASFRTIDRAQLVADQLRGRLDADTSVAPADLQTGRWYRVLVGDFATRQDATLLRRRLATTGEFAFLRTVTIKTPAPPASPATDGTRS
jgi:cell division septation protein DedD